MQKHIKNTVTQTNTLRNRKPSEYSNEKKNEIEETNRHQHDPHWEGNFIVSNLQPTYTDIQHDVSFSAESPK
jgi:hypothetical protein